MGKHNRGLLIVFSGPAGSGKSTVLAEYMKGRDDCAFSVSSTSRQPRKGEIDGVNYHFVSREEFERMVEAGEMLEHTEYCGNYYGTPIKPVLEALDSGRNVIFDIEVDGAFQVREKYPEAVLVFMMPPSMDELRRRLKSRGTENDEVIEARMERAQLEMALASKYDYVIVNDEVDHTVHELSDAISDAHKKAEKRR